jgi:hypothetical protein
MTTFYWFVVGALATWRVSHLLHAEDGPWNAVVRLRAAAGGGFLGEVMDCFYCLSLWVALPIAFMAGAGWPDRLLLWPALSGASILLERAFPERAAGQDVPPTPVQLPNKE